MEILMTTLPAGRMAAVQAEMAQTAGAPLVARLAPAEMVLVRAALAGRVALQPLEREPEVPVQAQVMRVPAQALAARVRAAVRNCQRARRKIPMKEFLCSSLRAAMCVHVAPRSTLAET